MLNIAPYIAKVSYTIDKITCLKTNIILYVGNSM